MKTIVTSVDITNNRTLNQRKNLGKHELQFQSSQEVITLSAVVVVLEKS